jgi:hypothetical protein
LWEFTRTASHDRVRTPGGVETHPSVSDLPTCHWIALNLEVSTACRIGTEPAIQRAQVELSKGRRFT